MGYCSKGQPYFNTGEMLPNRLKFIMLQLRYFEINNSSIRLPLGVVRAFQFSCREYRTSQDNPFPLNGKMTDIESIAN